jgi:Integral membrane protein (intg_mem_TP0381)
MTVTVALPADLAPISATQQFSAYSPSHLTVLVVFAIGSAALVWIGRRLTESQARLLGRVLWAITVVIFSVALLYKLLQPTIAHSVPLQLCDLAELAAAYALWSQRKWAFTLAYYWGLPLSSQALITPDLNAPDFPSHSFLTFWGYGMRPGWRSYRFAVVTTLAWGRSPSPSTQWREPTTAFSTGNPSTPQYWTFRALAVLRIGRGRYRRRGLGAHELALGAEATDTVEHGNRQ